MGSARLSRVFAGLNGGEGGIRTPVPVTRQDAFEAPPLRPLRYLSGTTDSTTHSALGPALRHDAPVKQPAPIAAGGYPADRVHSVAAVQDGHYWFESRNRLLTWAFRRFFRDASDFLEVGCGT